MRKSIYEKHLIDWRNITQKFYQAKSEYDLFVASYSRETKKKIFIFKNYLTLLKNKCMIVTTRRVLSRA